MNPVRFLLRFCRKHDIYMPHVVITPARVPMHDGEQTSSAWKGTRAPIEFPPLSLHDEGQDLGYALVAQSR